MAKTRACTMDSEKGKKDRNRSRSKDSGNEKSKMKSDSKSSSNCSNLESEEDDQNILPTTVSNPPGLAGSSIKVTIKKTRSSCSSSSRESAQSFEVVKRLPPTTESVSGEEDCENPKDSEQEKTSNKSPSVDAGENDKESEGESQNANSSDDSDVEILSDDSEESFIERPSPAVSVKSEEKNISINTVVDLKTEEPPQNSMAVKAVKKEECKIRIKSLKEEMFKEPDAGGDIVVVKDDDKTDDTQLHQPQNGVQKKEIKEQVKEQKFKLNVRSFDDLVDPRTAILINMPPPAQIDRAQNFLTQNGVAFPPPYLSCDVCGLQYDSPELLNDHKVTMKHFKCSFKECELLVVSSQQEFLEHQRMVHNIMPSPVQQLAHQVQRLPAMGFDQQLQSGVPPLPDNLSPSMYPQSLRMPNQQVPMQRPMRPMMRPAMPMMSPRGRNIQRGSSMRGRSAMLNSSPRGGSPLKRPLTVPRRGIPPMKRANLDRNSYTTTMNKSPQIAKSIAESLTKSASKNSPSPASQQDVVNLFSKRGLTISTVDNGNNSILPAGLSLNSAVSIIPTSPHKVPSNVPKKVSSNVPTRVSNSVSNNREPTQTMDLVDLTGPDKPIKYSPCEVCPRTFATTEQLYEHISIAHKPNSNPYRCNLCKFIGQNPEGLNRHKLTAHKLEINNSSFVIPIVDLSKTNTMVKLRSLGITSYLPVSQLDNQGGQFGVPIMTYGKKGNLEAFNATNYFSMGPMRYTQ